MPNSLQTRLLRLLALIVLLAALVTACFSTISHYLREKSETGSALTSYMKERGDRENRMFAQLSVTHQQAGSLFYSYYNNLDDEAVETMFDRAFHAPGDGTMRSVPSLYDGDFIEGVGPVRGIGAFLPAGVPMTSERKRNLVSAFLTLAQIAPAVEDEMESLWFASEFNDLLIFAPDREDRLIFYRQSAPADFNIGTAPFSRMSSLEQNPEGSTNCTPLSRLMYVESGEALTTGCQTPLRSDGVQKGVWGTTLLLAPAFRSALSEKPMDAADLFFISAAGEIIAHEALLERSLVTADQVAELKARLHPREIAAAVGAQNKTIGKLSLASDDWFADLHVFHHLQIPDWYLVIKVPHETLWAGAISNTLPQLIGSIAIILLFLNIFVIFVGKYGVQPLQVLADRFTGVPRDGDKNAKVRQAEVELISVREDEIGHLSRTLLDYEAQTEQHFDHLESEIAARTSELELANAAKSRFLATMSHELRTPMNGIVGVAGALKKTPLTEAQTEMADLICRSADILERQLTDILDISKIEAGHVELDCEPFRLAEDVSKTLDLYAAAAREKGIEFARDISDNCLGYFMGDSVRIRQIVANLMSNAIKFTEKGKVEARLHMLDQFDNRCRLELEIKDTGIGMDEEVIQSIFEPFSQANHEIYKRFGGTGLGLSICKSFVEMMNGEIMVDSSPGKGTTFRCRFVLTRCEMSELPDTDTVTDGDESVRHADARVLIAEDHAVNRRVLELILQPLGYELFVVDNGHDAVEAVKATRFDLILMDLQMPVMDGLTAVREIRAEEKRLSREQSLIITVSANTSDEDRVAAETAGANAHVAKPVTPERLINVISELLSASEDTRSVANI